MLHQRKVQKSDDDPGNQCEYRYYNNERNKIATDLICILLDRSLQNIIKIINRITGGFS